MYVCMYVLLYVGKESNAYAPAFILQILNANSNTNIAEVIMIGNVSYFHASESVYLCMYVRMYCMYLPSSHRIDNSKIGTTLNAISNSSSYEYVAAIKNAK